VAKAPPELLVNWCAYTVAPDASVTTWPLLPLAALGVQVSVANKVTASSQLDLSPGSAVSWSQTTPAHPPPSGSGSSATNLQQALLRPGMVDFKMIVDLNTPSAPAWPVQQNLGAAYRGIPYN
jgi:hypothetical protein